MTKMRYKAGTIIPGSLDHKGYETVGVMRYGKLKTLKKHVLVCTAFHGPKPTPHHQVRHLDGNRRNNHKDNLCWGTAKDNADDREQHGTHPKGENSGKSKLTNAQAADIKERYYAAKEGRNRVPHSFVKHLAAEYSVHKDTVYHIILYGGYPDVRPDLNHLGKVRTRD